jgi:hypothetical protein
MKKETCDMKTQHSRTFGIWRNGYNGRGLTAINVKRSILKISTLLIVMLALTSLAGAKEIEYAFGPDSLPQEGVPKGTVTKHTWNDSQIYPGTTHGYWVYVPAQYDASKPACVMVFQDGADFILLKGEVRVPTVFDNLIHKGEMPVTIGIFINPGRRGSDVSMRDEEYLPLNDTYARFLLEEILPQVGKDYNLVDDAHRQLRTDSRWGRVSLSHTQDPRKPKTHTRLSPGWGERLEQQFRKLDAWEHQYGSGVEVRPIRLSI